MEPRWSPACDLLTVPWLLWILPVVHVHIFTAIEKGHYLNIIPIVTIFYLFFFNPLNFYHVTCLLVTTSLVIRYCFTLFRNTLSPYWTGWFVRYRKWSPTVNDPQDSNYRTFVSRLLSKQIQANTGPLHYLIKWSTFGKHENSSLLKNFTSTSTSTFISYKILNKDISQVTLNSSFVSRSFPEFASLLNTQVSGSISSSWPRWSYFI